MIKRDYNHPSIFSWVVFNETWGLWTNLEIDGKKTRRYLPRTQHWVASMYYLAKSLDPSRLVEDNSICCGRGHVETDINSWHQYLPGWEWENHLKSIDENTYEGSTHHFEDGFTQGRQPNINSECGNVWGYEGSTGDVDWSWDYHRMMNSFRMFPKIGGWLYTEHHDVINEWNGYWRFDRSEKETGMGAIFEGMSLVDLHAPVYLSTGNAICKTVQGGQNVEVPLFLSVMTDAPLGESLEIEYQLKNTNYIGETEKGINGVISIPYQPWIQKKLESISIRTPDVSGLATLGFTVKSADGKVLQKNFMHFVIESGRDLPEIETVSVPAKAFTKADWSQKQWNVMDGKKVNGAGTGSFTYELDLTNGKKYRKAKEAVFLIELSAKELFVKDQEEYNRNQDFMKGSRVAPSSNPNAYPMTDETYFPSEIAIRINGIKVLTTTLEDDPADHRGVLSWHAQLKDRKLREAGSYGYLIKVPISNRMLKNAIKEGKMTVEIIAEDEGGIAVYGKDFGRYPLDPSLVLKY
jgi:hypothetical protein